jgi:hypothetical protein
MSPIDDFYLNTILRLNEQGYVIQKEDLHIEFKVNFERDSKEGIAKYSKELAALHNVEGGYLIFGIDDKTGEVKGLVDFVQPDNVLLSNDVNNYFSPAIKFVSRTFKLSNKVLFVIYVTKRSAIPTVCIRDNQSVLQKGVIYWRYPAKSTPIEAGDLINLLNSLRGELSEETTAVAKTRLKLDYKPRLFSNGGQGGMDEVKIKIENRGSDAKISHINVLSGNVEITTIVKLPYTIQEGGQIIFLVRTIDHSVVNNKDYSFEFYFEDQVGTNYKMQGVYKGAGGKLSEAEEI